MAEDKIFTVNAWKALLNNLITKFKTKDFTAKEKLTIGSSEIYNKKNGEQLDFSKVETKGITKIGDLKEEYIFEANSTILYKDKKIEKSAGYTNSGLYIDAATYGKWGINNESWPIYTTIGTKIYIPMYSSGTLIVNFYSSGTINIGLEETREVSVKAGNTEGNTEIEIFDSDIITFENNKYVVIQIGVNNYINYIKTTSQKTVYSIELNSDGINLLKGLVVQETAKFLKDLNVGYSVNTGVLSYTQEDFAGTIQEINKSTGSFEEITIDATSGKWLQRDHDWPVIIYPGTIFYIPYKGDGTLTMNVHDNKYSGLTVNGTIYTGSIEITEENCTDGNIVVYANGNYNQVYLSEITYNYSASIPLVSIKDGRISHGGNRTDDLKNQKIPFFKEITQEEYDNLTTKDEDVVYLIEE